MTAAPQRFSVAVTGHRPNRMSIGADEISRRLQLVLSALRSGARGRRRIAISALAEGSDRIFARAALGLDYELHAALPFASTDYETTFSNPSETGCYRRLLKRATDVTELPGTLADTKSAYVAVGQAMVDAADVLVAVWDGAPGTGRGGTPDVIEQALRRGLPVIWIDAAQVRLPRLIVTPTANGPRHLPLPVLAARSRPLSWRRIRQISKR